MTEAESAVPDNSNNRRNRNKRNKNARFMKNAKGFAKKGIFGRGTRIEDDQYNYFINILDAMKAECEDVEEKVDMANNVFEQTKEQELHLACNQIVCKALETLIGYVSAEHLERFFNVFADNFRPMCSDRFSSHVLQKMVEIAFLRCIDKATLRNDKKETEAEEGATAAKRAKVEKIAPNVEAYNLETEFTAEHKTNCSNFLLRISKFLLNNLEDFVWDACGNHIMRTCILSLAGVHLPKEAFAAKKADDLSKRKKVYAVPDESWLEVLSEFPQRLQMWPHFTDFPYQEHSSGLAGVICIALKEVNKNALKHFGRKLLMESFLKARANAEDDEEKEKKSIDLIDDDDDEAEVEQQQQEAAKANNETATSSNVIRLPLVFEYASAVHLLETLMSVAGPKLLTQIYAMLFAGRFLTLAKQQMSNFAVQKLLNSMREKTDFENCFAELADELEDLLKIGHTGVVSALSGACLRLASKQAQMIVALQKALHLPAADKAKAAQLFQCLIKLKPLELTLQDQSTFVHLHGSLIIQNILHFNKPIFLVNCILETPAEQLTAIFNTPNGSHILDAFLQSKFIGEKSREKLLRQLEGYYLELAITKFGSRVVENCFAAANEAQKARIVKELAEKVNMLQGSPFGRLVYSKLNVKTYQLSSAQWKSGLQKREDKAQQMFKDIIS